MASFKMGLTDAKLYRMSALMTEASDDEVESLTETLVENVEGDVTLTVEKGTAELRTRGQKFVQQRGTLINMNVMFNLADDGTTESKANIDFFRDAVMSGANEAGREICAVVLDGLIDTEGSQGPAANWEVTNFSRNEVMEGPLTYSVTLVPSSYPHWYEAPAAG